MTLALPASWLPYALGAVSVFLTALGYATALVAWWNRLNPATRTAHPRIGHYVVLVARLLPVLQGIGTALRGILSGAPLVSVPAVAPTPPASPSRFTMPPPIVSALTALAFYALVVLVTVLAFGCRATTDAVLALDPSVPSAESCLPGEQICRNGAPLVCSPEANRFWPALPPQPSGAPGTCGAIGCTVEHPTLTTSLAHCGGSLSADGGVQ